MRRVHLVFPVALVTLLACQVAGDPPTAPDQISASTSAPGLSAAALQFPLDYFLIYDDVPDRNYTATFGLVSSPSDLDACGGAGPEVYDGRGTTQIVATPSGAVHFRDKLNQATIIMYEGATDDVCELATLPELGRGTGNMHFTVKERANGSVSIEATFGGILDLTAGGRARMLGNGNIVFDAFGNLTVHVDNFDLKPIGH